jgi:uncharacterized protein YodC (DUF2158 family)
MSELIPGSVVRLNSGGPKMTVEFIDNKGKIHCSWFEDKTLSRSEFESVALRLVKKPKHPEEV